MPIEISQAAYAIELHSTYVLIGVFALGAYFFPSMIAAIARKRSVVAITALNFFLGWLVIPWVIALIWALIEDRPAPSTRSIA